MPAGLTEDLQTTVDVGKTAVKDNVQFTNITANTPAVTMDGSTSGGFGKVASYEVDGVEQCYYGSIFGSHGFLAPTVLFFALTNIAQGIAFSTAGPPSMWGGGASGFNIGHTFGAYNVNHNSSNSRMLLPLDLDGNDLIIDADGDSILHESADDDIRMRAASTDCTGWTNEDFTSYLGRIKNRTAYTTTATILATDHIVAFTGTSGGTLTIPSAAAVVGKELIFKDEGGNADVSNITIATASSETIDGAASFTMNQAYMSKTMYSDGTDWFLI